MRILLVDDSQDCRDTLSMLLRCMGHTVLSARDGPTAIELAAIFLPELILLDIGMVPMDGWQVAEALRGTSRICMLSAYGSDDDKERSRQAGAYYHFVKPFDLGEFCSVLGIPEPVMK